MMYDIRVAFGASNFVTCPSPFAVQRCVPLIPGATRYTGVPLASTRYSPAGPSSIRLLCARRQVLLSFVRFPGNQRRRIDPQLVMDEVDDTGKTPHRHDRRTRPPVVTHTWQVIEPRCTDADFTRVHSPQAMRAVLRPRRARASSPTRAAWPMADRQAGSSARRAGAGT